MRKKFGIFKEKYPHIISMLEKGYPYTDVILDLKDNHQLDLSFNTFRSYLYRYRKELNSVMNTSEKFTATHRYLDNHLKNADTSHKEESLQPTLPKVGRTQQRMSFKDRGQLFIDQLMSESEPDVD
ncbi:MAG: hypothetical protein ACN6NW_02850 [Acinetobacter amyesii]|uniref:hypothetical protein n=1 Tax=Acinetobacter amyesii TaxID=2942470 RepID=UPI003D00AC00